MRPWGLVVVPAFAVACASATPSSEAELRSGCLAFLRVGETTRRDALLQLGQPSASFEHESVLTWRLAAWKDDAGAHVVFPERRADVPVASWHTADFSLVLAFGPDGRLAQQSLVPVK